MSYDAQRNDDEHDKTVLDVIQRLTGAAPHVELRAEESAAPARIAQPLPKSLPMHRGQYRLVGEIARGGMGVILRGRDQDLGREVAIKVMHGELAQRHDVVQRFVEEAQISGQLQHPGIAPVYELGLMADDRPYFTMKLIRGRTFAEILLEREESSSDRRRMLQIFMGVCQTVAYAHNRGVIHRDLKPANVMVGAFGEVQVVDWGLAKVLGAQSTDAARVAIERESAEHEPVQLSGRDTNSLVGAVMGTPAYMPPEQALGKVGQLDERSDVFALGAILCEILTGGAPYGGGQMKLLHQASHALLEPAFADLARSGADAELVELCKTCLAPAMDDRPRNAGELVKRLSSYFESVEERVRRAQVETAEARVKAEEERRARKLTLGLAASVVATILVGVGAWVWSRAQREQREHATQALVEAALSEARTAQGAHDWLAAQSATGRARAAMEAGSPSSALRSRVDALDAEVQRDVQRARAESERVARNERLLERLYKARTLGRDSSSPPGIQGVFVSRDAAFGEAFRDWGLDIDASNVEDAARALRESGIAEQACGALDYWVTARRIGRAEWDEPEFKLVEIALAADTDPMRREIREAIRDRDKSRIMALSEQALAQPLPPPTASTLASELFAHSDYARSIEVLKRSYDAYPNDYSLAILLGIAFTDSGTGRPAEALPYYLVARALKPGSAEAHGGIAECYAALDQKERALEFYRRAAELDPLEPNFQVGLALLVDDAGESEQLFRRAIELGPKNAGAFGNFGRMLQMSGRAAEAVPILERAVELAPWSQHAWNNLGIANAKLGRHPRAIECYEKALEADGDDLGSRHNLALELRLEKQFERAENVMRRAIELAPDHPLLAGNYGLILMQLGREAEALRFLATAMQADGDLQATVALARIRASSQDAELRDPQQAVQLAHSALAREPREIDAHLALGIAHYRMGQLDATLEALRVDDAPLSTPIALALEATTLARLERTADARAKLEAARTADLGGLSPFERREFEGLLGEARAALER